MSIVMSIVMSHITTLAPFDFRYAKCICGLLYFTFKLPFGWLLYTMVAGGTGCGRELDNWPRDCAPFL